MSYNFQWCAWSLMYFCWFFRELYHWAFATFSAFQNWDIYMHYRLLARNCR